MGAAAAASLLHREATQERGLRAPDNKNNTTREYIQHSLRTIDSIGGVFSPASVIDSPEHEDSPIGGREEHIRAIQLLVMFMKNLLRKGKLPLGECAMDIEEVCVRYLWIAEVREFKRFLEGSELDDGGVKVDGGVGG